MIKHTINLLCLAALISGASLQAKPNPMFTAVGAGLVTLGTVTFVTSLIEKKIAKLEECQADKTGSILEGITAKVTDYASHITRISALGNIACGAACILAGTKP